VKLYVNRIEVAELRPLYKQENTTIFEDADEVFGVAVDDEEDRTKADALLAAVCAAYLFKGINGINYFADFDHENGAWQVRRDGVEEAETWDLTREEAILKAASATNNATAEGDLS
jgi:hypothetical protein